jgi:hypothetical protein
METLLLRRGYEMIFMEGVEGGGVFRCFSDLVHCFFKRAAFTGGGVVGKIPFLYLSFYNACFWMSFWFLISCEIVPTPVRYFRGLL